MVRSGGTRNRNTPAWAAGRCSAAAVTCELSAGFSAETFSAGAAGAPGLASGDSLHAVPLSHSGNNTTINARRSMSHPLVKKGVELQRGGTYSAQPVPSLFYERTVTPESRREKSSDITLIAAGAASRTIKSPLDVGFARSEHFLLLSPTSVDRSETVPELSDYQIRRKATRPRAGLAPAGRHSEYCRGCSHESPLLKPRGCPARELDSGETPLRQ